MQRGKAAELHAVGRALGQLQQMRPVARLGRIDGGMRALGQTQHAQSPEGVGVGPGLGPLGGVQAADVPGKAARLKPLPPSPTDGRPRWRLPR